MNVALFDLDNTLVDRSAAFRRWAESFASRCRLGEDAVDWFCAQDNDGSATRLELFEAAKRYFRLGAPVSELISAYRAEYPSHYSPDPALLTGLARLRTLNWRIAIVTNGPPSQVDKIRRASLDGSVDAWCISDELGWEKPDPRLFEEAIRRCGTGSSQTLWMIGDTPIADIEGGRRAGCKTVWLHRGRIWEMPEFAPDLIADSAVNAIGALLDLSITNDA